MNILSSFFSAKDLVLRFPEIVLMQPSRAAKLLLH